MKSVYILLMFILALMPLTISAQTPFNCGELVETDCQLLANALTGMGSVQSVQLEDLTITGASGAVAAPTSIEAQASGVIHFGDEATPFAGNLDFGILTVNRIPADGFPRTTDLSGVQIILQDNYAFIPKADEAYTRHEFNASVFRAFPTTLAQSLMEYSTLNAVTWSRAEEGEFVVFTADIALAQIVTSQSFLEQLEVLGIRFMPEGVESATVMFLVSSMLAQLAPQLDAGTFAISLRVSPTDELVYGVTIDLNFELDFGFLASIAGNALPINSPILVDMNVGMDFTEHNGTFTITAPADFTDGQAITLENLLGFATNNLPNRPTVNTADAEFSVAYGESLDGVFSAENTEDSYVFSGKAGDTVTITLQGSADASELDTYLKLYDSAGTLIAENDDAEDNQSIGLFDSEIKAFTLPADGDYVIVGTWLVEVSDGAYRLTLMQE